MATTSVTKEAVMFMAISVTKKAISLEDAKKCLTAVTEVAHNHTDFDYEATAENMELLTNYLRVECHRIYEI